MKRCSKCGETKAHSEFHKYKRGDGFQPWCKSCRKEYDRAYNLRNQGRWSALKKARKTERRRWLRDLKTNKPCTDCGRVFPPEAMEWDHLPGTEKLGELGTTLSQRSRKLILQEIAKCELVCANCHAIRTRARILASLELRGVAQLVERAVWDREDFGGSSPPTPTVHHSLDADP
jgi:hypothetical protein